MRRALQSRYILGGAAILAALFVFSNEVLAQSGREMNNRLKRLENEVETLSRAIYRGEQPPPGALSGGDASQQANIEIRLQELELQIRQLTGRVEEVSYENRQIKDQVERMASDLELRLRDLEQGRSPAAGISQGNNNGDRPQRGSPLYNSGNTATRDNGVDTPADRPSNTLGTIRYNADDMQSPDTQGGDDAAASYENAFSLLKAGSYDAAEREFSQFLRQHENHILAGNAKYWLGETFYVRGDFERAARIFAEGYQQYPEGSKSADNLLKLGLSLSAIGNEKDACIALRQLEKDYPSGSGPVLRRAEQEMSKLGC